VIASVPFIQYRALYPMTAIIVVMTGNARNHFMKEIITA
jgi:hypothetical protein